MEHKQAWKSLIRWIAKHRMGVLCFGIYSSKSNFKKIVSTIATGIQRFLLFWGESAAGQPCHVGSSWAGTRSSNKGWRPKGTKCCGGIRVPSKMTKYHLQGRRAQIHFMRQLLSPEALTGPGGPQFSALWGKTNWLIEDLRLTLGPWGSLTILHKKHQSMATEVKREGALRSQSGAGAIWLPESIEATPGSWSCTTIHQL